MRVSTWQLPPFLFLGMADEGVNPHEERMQVKRDPSRRGPDLLIWLDRFVQRTSMAPFSSIGTPYLVDERGPSSLVPH